MGPDLILAAIVATMITRGWEHSKRRASAEWSQARRRARQRAEEREKRRDERAQRRAQRFTQARRTGPRDPLWWPYATGWIVAASARAGFAALQGAREGGAAGAREGYRIGRESARERRERRERAAYVNGQRSTRGEPARDSAGSGEGGSGESQPPPPASEDSGEVPMDSCSCCGVYVTADALHATGRCRVCADPDHDAPADTSADIDPTDQSTKPADNDNTGKDDEPMTELAPTNGSAGTGEGYTDTVSTLQTLAAQLKAAHETAQALQANLTANEVDAATITNVGELMDSLDAAAPLAQQTAAHVVTRHEPVAEAHAAAGGSQNVAAKAWYDDH